VAKKPDIIGIVRQLANFVQTLVEYADRDEYQEELEKESVLTERKRKRAVKKVERLKALARKAVEPHYEPSWVQPAELGDDDWQDDEEMSVEEWKRKLATFISVNLDYWENPDPSSPDPEGPTDETVQKYRESVAEELLDMLETYDSNFGGIESEWEPGLSGKITEPQLFSVPWPNDDTTPLVFPPQTLAFRLKGVAVNGNVPPPGATTVDVKLTIYDGAGNVVFTSSAGPTVGQGDFTLQFQIPNQLPDGGIVILPAMRCEIYFGAGGIPPAGTYSMGTSVWMLDKV